MPMMYVYELTEIVKRYCIKNDINYHSEEYIIDRLIEERDHYETTVLIIRKHDNKNYLSGILNIDYVIKHLNDDSKCVPIYKLLQSERKDKLSELLKDDN
jgi:hypothetical protein